VRRQWFVPLALLIHFAIAIVITTGFVDRDRVSPSSLLWLILIVAPPVVFLSATGTLFSLLCRKSATAAAANLGLALALWAVGPALLGWFLYGFLDEPSWADEAMSVAMISNPVGMIAMGIEGSIGASNYSIFDLRHVGIGGFFVASLASAALYLGGTFLALRLASSILARGTARAR
jgi:hypothetical protein